MPQYVETTDGRRSTIRYRYACKPWVETSVSLMTYNNLIRQYNDVQHRTKPDPLTDTALPKQSTQRIKPSWSDWVQYGTTWDFSCSPRASVPADWRSQGVAESVPTFPAYTLDWSSAVLQHIAEQYVNIGSSLAEYRATANQFHSYGVGVANAWRRWKGLKKGRAKLTPCDVTGAELAYSFGVAPLVEDLYSSAEALRLRLEAPIFVDFFKTVTAYTSEPFTASMFSECTRKMRVSNRIDARIQLEPFSTPILFGNPSNWAWELIPFSFVVDWGIPIGQWLEDVDMLRHIISVKGTRTIKEKYVSFWKRYNTSKSPPAIGGWGKLSYQSHERKLLTSIPVPSFPRWKPSPSWHKVYRAVTLLIAVNQPCRRYPARRLRASRKA